MNKNDIYDFLLSTTREINDEYYRIQRRVGEDPGTAGDQGEENWATLFREWLPPTLQIVTKGRILGYDGSTSDQIDLLVLQPEYPKKLIDKKLYLAGGVLAAFECKITLRAQHIKKAFQNSVKIRNLLPERKGTPYKELNSEIFYGILAHSHEWKNENSKPLDNISRLLKSNDSKIVRHPREMLNLVCVADLASWSAMKISFFNQYVLANTNNIINDNIEFFPTTCYMQAAYNTNQQYEMFTPIGASLFHILYNLAWENVGMRRLANYYRQINLPGLSNGMARTWDTSIYSEAVKKSIPSKYSKDIHIWDEWLMVFQ